MWYVCLFLLLLPAAPQVAQPPTPTTQPAVTTAPTFNHGPLRGEVIAVYDARYWFLEKEPGERESELHMRFRFLGEKIDEAVSAAIIVIDEAVDNTGKVITGHHADIDEQHTIANPLNQTPERLRANGLVLQTRVESPSRGACTVSLRGSVRVIFGRDAREVTIDNPLQYLDKTIENEQLKELGVEIRAVLPEQLQGGTPPNPNRIFVLQYIKGQERVQGVSFHDAWMKPIRHRGAAPCRRRTKRTSLRAR